jgi:hypothetical protein
MKELSRAKMMVGVSAGRVASRVCSSRRRKSTDSLETFYPPAVILYESTPSMEVDEASLLVFEPPIKS